MSDTDRKSRRGDIKTHHSDKAAAQGHDSHPTRHTLKQHILDGREREAQVLGEQLKDGEAHETGGHGHDGHPSRLQAKVDIGSTDDGAHGQASHDTSDREAASGRYGRRHGEVL